MASSQGPTIQPSAPPPHLLPASPPSSLPLMQLLLWVPSTYTLLLAFRTLLTLSPLPGVPALEQISSASKEHLGIYNKEHSDSAGLGRARGGVCSKLLMLLLLLVREHPGVMGPLISPWVERSTLFFTVLGRRRTWAGKQGRRGSPWGPRATGVGRRGR